MSRNKFLGLRKPSRKTLIASTLALVVVSAAVVVTAIYKGPIAKALTLATTHQPETYTELYFVNSSALPTYASAQKPQHVVFHITNHEAKQVTYTYNITQNGTQIFRAVVALNAEQGVDVPFDFTITKPNSATQISVHLVSRSEHIDFRSKS